MKIQIVSDTHAEFYRSDNIPLGVVAVNPLADVLVLAGDVAVGDASLAIAIDLAQKHGVPVAWVPGNHEYYGLDYAAQRKKFENSMYLAESMGVLPLLSASFDYKGITFIGDTLWTDFRLYAGRLKMPHVSQAMDFAESSINDFRVIRNFSAHDSVVAHNLELGYIENELKARPDEKIVLVTHHGVHEKSVHGIFRPRDAWLNSPHRLPNEPDGWRLNPAFTSHLPQLFEPNLALAIHGHTHCSLDYIVNTSRVVANPRGYPRFTGNGVVLENTEFDAGLLIEV